MAGSGASRIQKPCDACKRYLDHLDGKNQNVRAFLSHMTSSSKHSMVVPKRFLKHFSGKLSGIIKLESPNLGSYDVEVTEHCNKVVFRHGWGQFVESHHIKENDYLLFRHVEGSCFDVLIFDPDGCEKVFSCAGIRSSDYGDILSSSHYETTESSASGRFVRCQKGSSCHHGKVAKLAAAFSSSAESGEDIPSEKKSSESDDLQTPRQHYVLSRRNYLSEAQEERVIALIQEIQPESTAFVAVMRKSHVQPPCPCLVISKGYALAHFPHKSMNVTLQTPGKSKKWHPKFYKRKDARIYVLKEQWMDFVRDNHVQEGDICLFLPTMAGRRSTFTVYLIQATSTCSRGGSGKRGSLSRRKETAKKAATSSLYEESGQDSLSGYESIQSDHVKAFSERNYVLSARCHLTAEQEEKIVALVKKVQPEIPFLVIQMKKSNVNHLRSDLVISRGYAAQHFPQESQSITLERPGGKKWRSRLHVRPDGRGYMLTTRWKNFVRDNHLQEVDICLFQPMPSEKGFRVMVHLLRERSTRSSSSDGHAHGLHNHIKRGVTSTAHGHEKSGSENSGSLDLHKRRAVQQGHQVLSDSGGPSSSKPPLYVVLGGTCLTPAQDNVVQERAMAITAEVSIFVVTMNKKILGYNNEAFILDFSDAAQYLPDGEQALTLCQQGQGRAWRTNLHNRLMLATGEWHEFVCDSGLEDGDICLFEPMKNERLAMLVHIIRSKQYS